MIRYSTVVPLRPQANQTQPRRGQTMRKLRLDDITLTKLLNELDALDARTEAGRRPGLNEYFTYRIPGLRVDLQLSRDHSETLIVPTRKLGPRGIYFLVSSLLHCESTCHVHLVTVRNSWQTVTGKVAGCRYLPGTSGVHEVCVRFDRPIDPASFAASAMHSRILAADDSQVTLKLYGHLLEALNVDLTCVSNGLEAVDLAMSETFDLILMDVEMPGLDGLSAVKMLRSKGYVRPIVAVSAICEPEDRERALASGFDDFVAKPITREGLAEVLRRNRSEPLVSALLDDPGMTELIDNFVDGLPATIGRLEAAYGSGNYEELQREARLLRGEAAGIGFGVITDAAIALEHVIKRGNEPATTRAKLSELVRLCLAARPATARARDAGERTTANSEYRTETVE